MEYDTILKQEIMQRVYFIYHLKRVGSEVAGKFALCAMLVALVGLFVSLPNVLSNMPSVLEPHKFLEFGTSAFLNTKLAIQVILVGAVLLFGHVVRDVRNVFRAEPLQVI